MPRKSPKWVDEMPTFLGIIASAKDEKVIRKACEEIRQCVADSYPHTPSSRERPMGEIRDAVREKYPTQYDKSENEVAPFPYKFTRTGKGNHPRWEHLSIVDYLKGWKTKETNTPDKEVSQDTEIVENQKETKPDLNILEELDLSDQELVAVNQAVGDADIKGWVKQAVLQRANAINKLRESLDDDWETIPSQVLMNDKKYRTNSAACRELVNRAVRVVKQWNYDHPEQKWCITNKLISELTSITVKAIAKAVEGMDNESYNKGQGLEPVINRLTRASVGEPKEVMSIAKVTGTEGSEVNYHPEKAIAS
jgi:hypothetical protein